MTHFDLSVYAFEKLADLKWGVMGIKWRRVPCEHTPIYQAPPVAKPWCALCPLLPVIHIYLQASFTVNSLFMIF